ncbi:MAG: hypothetical protein ACO1N0_00685 [Fluviicola sp.]
MIGKTIQSENHTYKITKAIAANNRPNANIYLCANEEGDEFIAKHFYNGKVSPMVPYGKKNHFGRRRDGSETVFYEIKRKSKEHDFLINHYERIWFENHWIIIIEYVEGHLLSEFISREYKSNLDLVKDTVSGLAETLRKWHSNGFAHGDPHLDNAIVQICNGTPKITLIDYSLIHHPDFVYCKQIGCFGSIHDRIKEDLRNDSNMGPGFLYTLKDLEAKLGLGTILSDRFNEVYHR